MTYHISLYEELNSGLVPVEGESFHYYDYHAGLHHCWEYVDCVILKVLHKDAFKATIELSNGRIKKRVTLKNLFRDKRYTLRKTERRRR